MEDHIIWSEKWKQLWACGWKCVCVRVCVLGVFGRSRAPGGKRMRELIQSALESAQVGHSLNQTPVSKPGPIWVEMINLTTNKTCFSTKHVHRCQRKPQRRNKIL